MLENARVDVDTIAMLKEVMEDGFANLIQTYLQDSEARLHALKDAIAAGDGEAIRQTAHSLKGSSGNVGATRMADLSLQAEMQGKDGKLAGLEALVTELEAEFAGVSTYMSSLL